MPVIDMRRTGERIAELRDKAGLDNADIAEALGFTTRNAVYKWLSGVGMPSLDNLVVLAKLFGVKLDDIVVVTTI